MSRAQTIAGVFSSLDPSWEARKRLDECAAFFVRTPYCSNPLGGIPGELDPPAYSLDCFDCMTFVEATAAIALSRTPDEYVMWIDRLRYRGSSKFWANRLHYFSLWLESNWSKGILELVLPESAEVNISRRLDLVTGIGAKNVEIVAHPWEEHPNIASANIIGFVSLRSNLDVFHVGILGREGKTLFHASESVGEVVREPLTDFLSREEGAGLLLARIFHRFSKRNRPASAAGF